MPAPKREPEMPATPPLHEARTPSDRTTPTPDESLRNANERSRNLSPTRKVRRKALRRSNRRQSQPSPTFRSPADKPGQAPAGGGQMLLSALARLRLLTYRQLRDLLFPGVSLQAIGQRMKRVAASKQVTVWVDHARAGGHPRYVLPTDTALRAGLDALTAGAAGTPYEQLVTSMLPSQPRRPLALVPRQTPPFLAHQSEVNSLLVALTRCPRFKILWASSWDRPFPSSIDGQPLPQPDWVAVFEVEGAPQLIFGEHDRGHESLARFRVAKADKYAELHARPELVERLFGFSSFEVWVTVIDARLREPIRRLEALTTVAIEGGAERIMRFTLGGWLYVFPGEAVWFTDGAVPEGRAVGFGDHVGDPALRPAFEPVDTVENSAALPVSPAHTRDVFGDARNDDPSVSGAHNLGS